MESLFLLIVVEIADPLFRDGRNLLETVSMSHGVVSEHAGCDRVSGGDRRGVGFYAVADEIKEVLNGDGIASAVSAFDRFDVIDDVRRFSGAALSPDMDLGIAAVSDVFNASSGADEGVIAFGVRSVMALHVGGLGAVFHLHHNILLFHLILKHQHL